MGAIHLAALACLVVAGACFLLVSFGIGSAGALGLEPLGLLFFVIGLALHGHHAHLRA